ncbi:MAG: beta-lactamase family protein [Gemmatimonadales bacterium]|nr:beta-lactamase family protein [Gemmatimonadales bacterium]MBP6572130.1 beta-lactamase family protein [Gemmatimonadales bacterium]
MNRTTRVAFMLLLAGCSHGLPNTTPLPVSPTLATRLAPAVAVLDSAIRAGAAPGAVLALSIRGERFVYGTGRLGLDDATRPDGRTLYDMASLTKVITLTTLAMMAVDDGRLDLDAPVVRYLPDFARGSGNKTAVRVRDLLLHDSGLPPGRPLWLETIVRAGGILRTVTTDLSAPPGTRMVYSDLGAITLTAILEQLYGQRIDQLFATRVTKPLGLTRMRYLPPKGWLPQIAPTEKDPWRGRVLRGEVHDENTARLGGVSGHAGLFSSAEDLLQFGEWTLAGVLGKMPAIGPTPPKAFPVWTKRQEQPAGSSRGLGWDTPSGVSSAGTIMSARSYGHTGFTGTSIWVDPDREIVIVLLTNRVHPTRNTPAFGLIRAVVADAVMRAAFPGVVPRGSTPP